MEGSTEPDFMYISIISTCLWRVEALNPSKFNRVECLGIEHISTGKGLHIVRNWQGGCPPSTDCAKVAKHIDFVRNQGFWFEKCPSISPIIKSSPLIPCSLLFVKNRRREPWRCGNMLLRLWTMLLVTHRNLHWVSGFLFATLRGGGNRGHARTKRFRGGEIIYWAAYWQ